MLKKVIPIAMALCLIFTISVMAENENITVENSAPEISGQTPQNTQEPLQVSENMEAPPPDGMQGRKPPNMPNGEMPPEGIGRGQRPQGNFAPPQNAGEFTPPQGEINPLQNNNTNGGEVTVEQEARNESTENPQALESSGQFGGQMPGGMNGFGGNMQSFNGQTQEEQPKGFLGFVKTYSTPITSVVLLGLAFIFVIFYRRKNY